MALGPVWAFLRPMLYWGLAWVAFTTEAGGQTTADRTTITDGDTLKVGSTIYRLWGIDAPEAKQNCPDGWPAGHMATTMRTLPAHRGKRAAELHDILHRATSGRERGRYGQKQREWRTVFMSASNESVSAIFREGAIGFDGATAVRCIEIPCFNRYGAFHRVPKGTSAKRFVDGMVEQASSLPGQIGDMFIQRLVVDRAKDEAALRATLKAWIAKFEKAVGAQFLGNELGRVVPKFGLVYAAGRLAQRYGVLPWSPKRILRTVIKVFNQSRAHQAESGGGDPKGRIIEFITKHGPGLPKIREGRPAKSSAKLLRGPGVFYRRKDGIVEYCFLPQQLARILGGAGSLKAAQSELVSSGLLKVEGGSKPRVRSRRRLVEGRRSRVFCIDRDAVKRLAAHARVSKG